MALVMGPSPKKNWTTLKGLGGLLMVDRMIIITLILGAANCTPVAKPFVYLLAQ